MRHLDQVEFSRGRKGAAHGVEKVGFGRRMELPLEADVRGGIQLETIGSRDALQLGRVEDVWRECQRQHARQRREARIGAGEVAREDAIAGHRQTGGVHRHHEGGEKEQPHHCLRLLACWYISSAAFTTFEFASYARWLVIILMNSSTTLTFDCSM